MANQPVTIVTVLNLKKCARCGQDHNDIKFYYLIRAPGWRYCVCPVTNKPLLIGPSAGAALATGAPIAKNDGPAPRRHCCRPGCDAPAQYMATWGAMDTDYTEGCGAHIFALVDGDADPDNVVISPLIEYRKEKTQ